ncbi:hypothetical protein [Microcystis aeruginosa]|uniref:hypothetical protein n=1 Tax=Microcystis aeruginosa TaxID=1126 RepID=UPI00111693E0|nr:hypothetical protein [Microcystis aeruginosa]
MAAICADFGVLSCIFAIDRGREQGVGCRVWGVGEWGVGCGVWGVGCGEWGVGWWGSGVWGVGRRENK